MANYENGIGATLSEEGAPLLPDSMADMESVPVFRLIHRVRWEVQRAIDTVMSYDQLQQPSLNFSVVRPLHLLLVKGKNPALPYALLLNRAHFLNEAENDLAFQGRNTTRASLCELLTLKSLASYSTEPMELVLTLTQNFNPFQGATVEDFASPDEADDGELQHTSEFLRRGSLRRNSSKPKPSRKNLYALPPDEEELKELIEWGKEESANALELMIFTGAKKATKSPLVQSVIQAIYTGEVVWQSLSSHSVLSDNYKTNSRARAYDVSKAPLLDHYRLRVPRVRSFLEFCNFAIIVVLFLLCQANRDDSRFSFWEGIFGIFMCGYMLDEFSATQEVGLTAYLQSLWNLFDVAFLCTFMGYAVLRGIGLHSSTGYFSELAFDTLAVGGIILFPRVAGSLLEQNIVILGLKAMISQFAIFMVFSLVAISGFLFSLRVLAQGQSNQEEWTYSQIAWLLLKIWFGSSYAGFDQSQSFHPFYGPIVLTAYAAFSNTLLLTILISILSNTFTQIESNAAEEFMYIKAMKTVERLKGDALAEFPPPLNLFGLAVLTPLSFLLTPRYFHKINVLFVKVLNSPILIGIAIYERLIARGRFYRLTQPIQRVIRPLSLATERLSHPDGFINIFSHEVGQRGRRIDAYDRQGSSSPSPRRTPMISMTPLQEPLGGSSAANRTALSRLRIFGGGRKEPEEASTSAPAAGTALEERLARMEATQSRIEEALLVLMRGHGATEALATPTGSSMGSP